MKEIVNITPDTSLLPKLGKSGYSLPQAIAELVDNSIDAIDTNQKVGEINVTIEKSFIKVYDNGSGMTKEELINSLRLAKSNKQNQLGRFGLGLKTAALSLGSYFDITTKSDKENHLYTVNFDEENWGKQNDWTISVDSTENNGKFSFTEIIIKSLKSKIPVNTIDKIKLDIGQRYAPYIQNGEINVYVNKQKCLPLQPFY
jgi:DNA topoisomerase VI subunit B